MKKAKVLFVFQEITPYLEESHLSNIGRHLPQGIQEKGNEIRTFMPRFGCINERRNQLHEVIRLSGMNLIIDESDHPLIIKVASIQLARMQVYFIDNDDYFQRKYTLNDKSGKFFKDNDERCVFFCRGVLETVKKLGWAPDIIHCHGWITSLIPFYIKTALKDNPLFSDSKIIYSVYDDDFDAVFGKNFEKKLLVEGIEQKYLKLYNKTTYESLTKAAIKFSDAVIKGSENINSNIEAYLSISDKPVLPYQAGDDYIDVYSEFYDEIFVDEMSLVE